MTLGARCRASVVDNFATPFNTHNRPPKANKPFGLDGGQEAASWANLKLASAIERRIEAHLTEPSIELCRRSSLAMDPGTFGQLGVAPPEQDTIMVSIRTRRLLAGYNLPFQHFANRESPSRRTAS